MFDRFKKKAEEAGDAAKSVAQNAAEKTEQVVEEVKESVEDVVAEPVEPPPSGEYRKVMVRPGGKGWGTGLVVEPKPGQDLIYSVTGGGIHPVAQRIADLSGGKPFDGFKSKADFSEIACAVIDCGGTARIGVYPMKGVLTVDIHGASPSGPLMRFITEENFVSGTGVNDMEVVD
jgi:sorbitol-specific phosphotransferase system component IIBC